MNAMAGIAGSAEQRFPKSRELIEMLSKSEVPLQSGQESLFDLSEIWISGDRLSSERETRADQSFLPYHLAGDIVIAAAIGDAAADHLAGVVQDDCLGGGRAEVDADIDPESVHAFTPVRLCSSICK